MSRLGNGSDLLKGPITLEITKDAVKTHLSSCMIKHEAVQNKAIESGRVCGELETVYPKSSLQIFIYLFICTFIYININAEIHINCFDQNTSVSQI